ncbi:MAG: FKBP-type peptidyl-prolyl cis-trans isomerase [Verrucomicrobia bacterium]|nr:FKBP-type peptidyl-prolyl cis-trans isomerase [Cytophagales bacterium]
MDSVSYCMGISIAQNVKNQGLDSINADAFAKGMQQFYASDSLLVSPEKANEFLQGYFSQLYQVRVEKQKAEGRKFLEANKTKPGVVTTASGLQYQIVTEGTGPKPKATDRITAHYAGTLIDGKEFDSSIKRGQPATFGVTEVITGWTEALQLMPVGSKWKLFIPSELGYGEQGSGRGVIPPHATLIFDIELLGIETPPPAENPKTQKKANTSPKK